VKYIILSKPIYRYVISDIHGCAKTFRVLLKKLKKPNIIYLLGDYIDRGKDSKGVIDIIMSNSNMIPIRGNHEQRFLEALENEKLEKFLSSGGKATLKSFGVSKIGDVPKKYIEWMKSLKKKLKLSDYKFVHDESDTNPHGKKKLVVGHKPKKLKEIIDSLDKDTIYVDGNCVRGGYLVALDLNNLEIVTQKNIEG